MAESNNFSDEEHSVNDPQLGMPMTPNETVIDCNSDICQNAEEAVYDDQISHMQERALQRRLNIVRATDELQEVSNSLVQQREALLDIEKELDEEFNNLTNELEKTLKNTYNYILKFRENYNKCESALRSLLQNAELRLNLCNIPEHYQENIWAYFPILSRDLAAYSLYLTSSKVAFEEFESLSQRSLEQRIDIKINHLTKAIDKAHIACNNLRAIVLYED